MCHEEVILCSTTGIEAIDHIMAGIVDLYEFVFPEQIESYLLLGSYSDGSAVGESDLDICMLFKSRVEDEERQRFMRVMRACQNLCQVRLDLVPLDERHLQAGVSAAIKEALVIYGNDLSSGVAQQSLERAIRRSMLGALHYMFVLRGKAEHLAYPLSYPDPAGEFYGYERWGGFLGGSTFVPGLRIIINSLTMISTTWVALQVGVQVGSKSRSVQAYRQHIGGEWGDWLNEIYVTLKTRWQYQIPTDQADRVQLRLFCEGILSFENRFLELCRPLLIADQLSADKAVCESVAIRLQKINVLG